MRRSPAVLLLVLAAFAIGSATPMMLKAQNGGMGSPGVAGEDMPHRTAKAFAPFLKAVITKRYNTAQQIFKIRRSVESSLEEAQSVRILNRFNKPERMDLNLVGGKTLGQNIGILLFTVGTEDGPVAFKIYYYGFGNDISISRLEMSDDWDEIETLAKSVDSLTSPVTVSLGMQPDAGP